MQLASLIATTALLTAPAPSWIKCGLAPLAAPQPSAPVALAAPALIGFPDAETVSIESRDKQTLKASFLAPKASKSLVPGALLVHSAGGDRNELTDIAKRLQKQGFGVLVLDLRGHGESISKLYNFETASEDKDRESMWAFSLKDLAAGAEFLASDKRVHSTSLAMVGYGAGCNLAARYAARDENVRALAMLCPEEAALGFDLTEDLVDLAGLPTLVVVSDKNKDVGTRIVEEGTDANGGEPFIELSVSRKAKTGILSDKRLPGQVSKWLSDQATPKRARG